MFGEIIRPEHQKTVGKKQQQAGPTVVVQFEALVHDHHGYSGESSAPVPGAVRALNALRARGYQILVESSRPAFAVEAYLVEHHVPFDHIVASPDAKALFTVVADGRAGSVRGDWLDVVDALQSLE